MEIICNATGVKLHVTQEQAERLVGKGFSKVEASAPKQTQNQEASAKVG